MENDMAGIIRIYDAAFATESGTSHQHLGTFWWVDQNGNTGQWKTRQEAYDFVIAHYEGYVYVSESGSSVTVWCYSNQTTGVKWIQTHADDVLKDNLVELAKRHRQGLVNR